MPFFQGRKFVLFGLSFLLFTSGIHCIIPVPEPPVGVPDELVDLFNFLIQTGSNIVILLGQVISKYLDTALTGTIQHALIGKRDVSHSEDMYEIKHSFDQLMLHMDNVEKAITKVVIKRAKRDTSGSNINNPIPNYTSVLMSTINTAFAALKAIISQLASITSQLLGMYQIIRY